MTLPIGCLIARIAYLSGSLAGEFSTDFARRIYNSTAASRIDLTTDF
jgi:hypothetical protein